MSQQVEEARNQIMATVRDFVQRDVIPHASEHDEDDTYPQAMVEQMKTLGLFICSTLRESQYPYC